MTLLSGGEQALTALSLIFAVFLTNPAPICVMDEVDAPLDDANVERFCNLLDEMARTTETRFITITHNPITMARMSRLFGVTMAERGVSQLVSVDLETAERFLRGECEPGGVNSGAGPRPTGDAARRGGRGAAVLCRHPRSDRTGEAAEPRQARRRLVRPRRAAASPRRRGRIPPGAKGASGHSRSRHEPSCARRWQSHGFAPIDDEPLAGFHRFYVADPFGNRLEFLERVPDPPAASRRSKPASRPRFTDKQGQYLAFIDSYIRMFRRAPAETDMQRHFRVSPPSVHQMVLTLERRGLITRGPGVARSIELLVPPGGHPGLALGEESRALKSASNDAIFRAE